MIHDRDLLAFRQSYYELFVSLLWREPSGDLLLSLLNGMEERIEASRNLHPLLAAGWEQISRFLKEKTPEQLPESVADEYLRLFISPHGPEVNPYESFYFTGRMWDRPLANLRAHLKAMGVDKRGEYPEPEDFLAFELEVMRWLIGKQADSADPQEEKRWLQHQSNFLKQHLLIWSPACAQDIERAEGANFYRGLAMILRGFLEMERTLFPELAPEKVTSLGEVRRLYGAIPSWRGPTLDIPDQGGNRGPARQKD